MVHIAHGGKGHRSPAGGDNCRDMVNLHRRADEGADEPALEGEIEHEDRDHHQHRGGHGPVPEDAVLAEEGRWRPRSAVHSRSGDQDGATVRYYPAGLDAHQMETVASAGRSRE